MDISLPEINRLIEALEVAFAIAVATNDQARKNELQAAFQILRVLRAKATVGIADQLGLTLNHDSAAVAGNLQRLTDPRTILTLQSLSDINSSGVPTGSPELITPVAQLQSPIAVATGAEPPKPPPPVADAASVDPTKRHTALELLHPKCRSAVLALIEALKTEKIPMKIFESYRTPERQAHLFAQGRTRDLHLGKVTKANAWESYHQYGIAVDMVIDHPDHGMWETGNPTADRWWKQYHDLAKQHGLEPLSFELPHVQVAGLKTSRLLSGEDPGPGDESWESNFSAAVSRWPGSRKPPLPTGDRPPLAQMVDNTFPAQAGIDWTAMPRVAEADWRNMFGGQEWRVKQRGIYLRGVSDTPLRTPGTPSTIGAALEAHASAIGEACQRFGLPPELVLMTIATETGNFKVQKFTGPDTFRWEQGVTLTNTSDPTIDMKEKGDYSAGPMQILSNTAREVNSKLGLEIQAETELKWFKDRPSKAPLKLGLYDSKINILLGAGYIHMQRKQTELNPVLVAAAYNSGSLRASGTNLWRLQFHGDHVDRACNWFGDACSVMELYRG